MLSTKQKSILIALGVFFWLAFAIAIKYTPILFNQSTTHAALFIASIPIAWLLVSLLCRLAKLAPHQILTGICIAVGAATLCDGLALTWLSSLYGDNDLHIRLGAAYILWGVGLFLTVALIRTKAESD